MFARRNIGGLVCGAWLVAMTGCGTTPLAPPGSVFVVTAPRSQFYKYGPAQAFGADMVLPHGQKVTMLETAFGYSKVMTVEGMSGYVASDEIAPAPPEPPPPKATPTPKPTGRTTAGKPRRNNAEITPGSPLFDMGDVPPPPLPEDPDPQPTPKLR